MRKTCFAHFISLLYSLFNENDPWYPLPIPVDKRSKNCEVSLNGDGDGHKDTAGEENVGEGIEEVGEKKMVNLHDYLTVSKITIKPTTCSPWSSDHPS